MEIKFSVEVPRATVRAAAQILGSLAVMRHGVHMMFSYQPEDFGGWVPYREREYLRRDLLEIGRSALERRRLPEASAPMRFFTAQALLQTPSPEDDLRLVSVSEGSIESVIEELLKKLGEIFRRLLESTNSIVKGGEGRDLIDVLGGIAESASGIREAVGLPETVLVGAGVVMVGAENLRQGFEAHGVTGVNVIVTATEEAEEA